MTDKEELLLNMVLDSNSSDVTISMEAMRQYEYGTIRISIYGLGKKCNKSTINKCQKKTKEKIQRSFR
jgi:hypothetical protein